jgi:hypothetical protein
MESFRFVQGEPDCCPFKDFKCPHSGESKKVVFIADIPLEERHRYIDPEQNINDPRMKVMGHPTIKIVNPLEITIQEQAKTINTILEHLKQLTTAVNNLSK